MYHPLHISFTLCEHHMETEYGTIDNSFGIGVVSRETSTTPSHTDLVLGGSP